VTKPADTEPIRVVIADDTPDMRLLLRSAFRLYPGFLVVGEADNGDKVVDIVRETRPDVVLLDLAMPGRDGLEAIPEILEMGDGRTKVVVLSGFNATEMRPEAYRRGAHGYIEKGAPPERLIATVLQVCNRTDKPLLEPLMSEEDKAHDEMLSYITHELSSPLAVVRGFAEILAKDSERMPITDTMDSVQAILRGSKQMQALLDNFSDARRVATDAVDLVVEETDLGSLIEQTAQDMQSVISPHPVSVKTVAGVKVKVDPVRIRQILTNLLANAAKFSPSSEPIDIKVEPSDEAVRVVVRDHGAGIPADTREKLFKKFSRLQRNIGGMGLGLFISRGIARAHGGDLFFEEPPDGGSKFVLRLPR
jgi:signal transduction histidine kinase